MRRLLFILLILFPAIHLGGQKSLAQEGRPPHTPVIVSRASTQAPPEIPAEMMLFDIYLADTFEGSAVLEYTETWFELQEPADAVEQLPNLKEPEKVQELLSGRIYQKRTITEVGTVEIDLSTFRLIVRLKPSQLYTKELTIKDRIPSPENELSFNQRFRGAVSGESQESYNSAVNHRSNLSFGSFWANYDGTWVQNNDYEVTEGSLNGILGRTKLDLGLLRTQGQFFTSSSDYIGLGITTTEEVYLDQDLMQGSTLEVFVPSRARVEFYKGPRLLAVRDLNFGLQQIDTTPFPQGSYDVDIVIREDNGRVSRDRKFFTKSGLLAARDRPVYFLQAGALRDELDIYSTPVYQLGTTWRAADILQLSGSVYGDDKTAIGSGEFLAIYRIHQLRGGYLHSNDGDSAITASWDGLWGSLSWNFSLTEVLKGFHRYEEVDDNPIDEIEDDILDEEEDPFKVFSNTRSNLRSSISLFLDPFTLRLSANRTKAENRDGETLERYAYGPQVDWNIIQSSNRELRLQLAYYDTDEGKEASAYLTYTYRFGNYTSSTGGSIRKVGSNHDSNISTGIIYDNKTNSQKGTRVDVSGEMHEYEQEETSDSQFISRAQIDHKNNFVDVSGFVRDLRSSENSNTALGATGDSVIAFDHQGKTTLTSPTTRQAMLIANVKSNSTKQKVEVVINGQTEETVKAGSRVAVGISPYRVYKINIRPTEDGELVSYDTSSYTVTAFPGTIVSKTWWVDKVFIALGRLVDEKGSPITYQRIKGTQDYTITEEDGSFQTELTGNEQLHVKSSKYNCTITLPQASEEIEFFYDYGDVVCKK